MTALNTISSGADDEYVFGMTPEPAEAAAMGRHPETVVRVAPEFDPGTTRMRWQPPQGKVG